MAVPVNTVSKSAERDAIGGVLQLPAGFELEPPARRDIFDDLPSAATVQDHTLHWFALALAVLVWWLARRHWAAIRVTIPAWFRRVWRVAPAVLPVVLFVASVSFAPYRSPAASYSPSERIFCPLYLPPSSGDYRLDITLLAAQWAAIGAIAYWLHVLKPRPKP
jgi:hypothetical protein